MKFKIFLVLTLYFSICKIINSHKAGLVRSHEICSLPIEEKDCQKYYKQTCDKISCDGKHPLQCGQQYCASGVKECLDFIETSIYMRSISKPKIFNNRNRNY